MKCEYCENEIPANKTDVCPYCGAALVNFYDGDMQALSQSEEQAQSQSDESIDVICPHCKTVYQISPEEWGEHRECQICHSSFQLTYGELSSEQIESILKNNIGKVIASWRNGKEKLFAARQCPGDILLKPGEFLYEYIEEVVLSESRGIRRTSSTRSSHRDYDYDYFDNRKRRTGDRYNYQGHSETATDYEFRELDKGILYLTNRRLFFIGDQMQRSVVIERITSFVPDLEENDEIKITEEAKQKVLRFSFDEERKYSNLMSRIESEEDIFSFFRFSLTLKALRNAQFKRYLLEASSDEVIAYFMEFPYFQHRCYPQITQLPQPTQEVADAETLQIPPVVKTILIASGVLGVLLLLSSALASFLGIGLIWGIVVILVILGPVLFAILAATCQGERWRVNGIIYNDVSGMGLLRSSIASLLAGLRGEGIITGYDKMNGTWDQMRKDGAERL